MSLVDDLDAMATRTAAGRPRAIADRINLYTEGVKGKLRNAELALADLEAHTGEQPAGPRAGFTVRDHIHLSTDSFFAFLYSSLDVMAQVVNQVHTLSLEESKVSFSRVRTSLGVGTPLRGEWDRAVRSHWYKNLDNYRNCSTHRRQIYIEQRVSQVQGTPGYSTTGPVETSKWVICDNPLTLRPTTRQSRELVAWCRKELNGVREFLTRVSRAL